MMVARVGCVEMESAELQRMLERCWTISDLIKIFRVTGMTIHNWRAHRGLPSLVIPGERRDALRFVPADVIKWAQENNVKMHGKIKVP